jgi:prolyl-tRNA editing enzyme YbaK/EbsC (Cys-tRNA(Pro) deacylase)
MKMLDSLRAFLAPYAHAHLRNEPLCSCGDSNHVRILLFRAAGRPITVIVPEAAQLTPQQMGGALGGQRVEPLREEEMDAIFEETDLGRSEPFSNPFGADVYLDESLILYPTLVFCPRMFGGRAGECFRVPTRDLLDGTRASVLPLVAQPCAADDWAV